MDGRVTPVVCVAKPGHCRDGAECLVVLRRAAIPHFGLGSNAESRACTMLFLAAFPADAHFLKRHHIFASPVIQSPLVQSLANVGVSQIVPARPSDNTSTIYVDASVKTKITSAKSNLTDANAILQKLLEKNKITPSTGGAAPKGPFTDDDPKLLDSPPPLR
jgi:hypothetical protein